MYVTRGKLHCLLPSSTYIAKNAFTNVCLSQYDDRIKNTAYRLLSRCINSITNVQCRRAKQTEHRPTHTHYNTLVFTADFHAERINPEITARRTCSDKSEYIRIHWLCAGVLVVRLSGRWASFYGRADIKPFIAVWGQSGPQITANSCVCGFSQENKNKDCSGYFSV